MTCAGSEPTLVIAGAVDRTAHALAQIAHERGWRVATLIDRSGYSAPAPVGATHTVALADAAEVESTLSALTSSWGSPPAAIVYFATGAEQLHANRAAVTESAEGWELTQAQLLRAGFLFAQAGVREMLRLRGGEPVDDGSVVFVGDAGVIQSPPGFPNVAMTAATSGLAGITRQLATEWGPFGVRVNMLQLGVSETQSERSVELLRRVPLGRAARPEELAESCYYLISRTSSYVTGAILPVDGGFLAN
ncbi:SDR family NAD(P)-dependent oxidoreductase [Leucobacter sp. W1153]|uniref:SDR family NAD(P)-dependent oxidoreductase n=1 Tax=Leucobacter sp. W1153 TaxID=3439064 RepID=UPI003F3B82A8